MDTLLWWSLTPEFEMPQIDMNLNLVLFLLQSSVIRSVCAWAIRHPAAVSRIGPREGGVCGYELPRPLPGAERPHPQRTHHLQQIPQCHHRTIRWHHSALREPGVLRNPSVNTCSTNETLLLVCRTWTGRWSWRLWLGDEGSTYRWVSQRYPCRLQGASKADLTLIWTPRKKRPSPMWRASLWPMTSVHVTGRWNGTESSGCWGKRLTASVLSARP